jgi:hypothetical protein
VISDLAPADGAELLVFTNAMGGTPLLELYLLHGEIERELTERGLRPARRLVGPVHHVARDGGASLTVLELDDELAALWDARCTPPRCAGGSELEHRLRQRLDGRGPPPPSRRGRPPDAARLRDRRRRPRHQHDARLRAVVEALAGGDEPPRQRLILAGKTLVSTVGGASGPLWGTALAPRRPLGRRRRRSTGRRWSPRWTRRWRRRRARARRAGRQDDGRRARPRVAALRDGVDAGDRSPSAGRGRRGAEEGARSTVPMQARKGRASYLGERSVGHQDPAQPRRADHRGARRRPRHPG